MGTAREPALLIELEIETSGGRHAVLTRENSGLFKHWGELAIYDHVRIELKSDQAAQSEPEQAGTPVYLFSNDPRYAEVAAFIEKHQFPQYVHLVEVSPDDKAAFDVIQMAGIMSGYDDAATGDLDS